MTWHVGRATALQYVHHRLDPTSTASVEAHMLECAACRLELGAVTETPMLDAIWDGIVDTLDRPPEGWIERLLRALGCRDVTTRIVAAAPRARFAYVLAVVVSIGLSVIASRSSYDEFFGLFLLVAPLGPLAATALAFGSRTDPAFELVGTLPTSTLRLVLTRTIAAVGPAMLLTSMSLVWMIERGWLALAWMLPSLGLAALALALSTYVTIEIAATVLGALWVAVPIVARARVSRLVDAIAGPVQVASLVAVVIGVLVVLRRSSMFDYREV